MRKITTAITAAALAFSMFAAAVPAAAVVGYDSAYAGESAFVNITAGQTQNFQVFFANTGTTSWVKSTGTQVDLAACLEDKVTCNAQDASEATWNPSTGGWLSPVRYATTTQTTTPPGSLGTFSYNITAPTGVAAGIFHFNGDLVVASSGERIHPEGYFQDANTGVSAGAATITLLNPNTGSSNGGDTITITGTGIVCNPTFPTVSFGGTNGVVTSCGATALTVTTPAHAVGSVTVTVTNPGAAASNGLTFTFNDTTTPKFLSFTIQGKFVAITWSEGVCKPAAAPGTPAQDWTVLNVSAPAANPVAFDGTPTCNATFDNLVTVTNLQLTNAMPNGSFVEATLNSASTGGFGTSTTRNTDFQDAAGNNASAPQARQATATAPETTKPQAVSGQGAVGSSTITLTFSEPVYCTGFSFDATDLTITDGNASTTDPVAAGAGTNACGGNSTTADTSFSFLTSIPLPADRTYTVTLTPEGSEITDIVGNVLGDPSGTACNTPTLTCTVTFTTGAGDFTPPTLVDARMANNLASTDFADIGDSYTLTFSEEMNGVTNGAINIQDQDGTTATIQCSGVAGANQATCTWNTAVTTLTVTLTGALTPTAGTTPNMQIPFNITSMTVVQDLQGNPPNILGSADRLVDFE
jgi:hypothetical protein